MMRVYLVLQEPSPDDDVFARLQLPLIQTIAATELMLQGWVEPPEQADYDLSTLTQQIMSVIAQTGGAAAEDIYRRLCRDGAFPAVDTLLFAKLLRCLGAQDVIEQTPTGELILGLLGERIRQKRDFYAVFLTPEEFSVLHQGQVLGQLPITWLPPPGEHLLLPDGAGRLLIWKRLVA
jgi:ATP-dependent Lhr-like helicase